MCTHALFAKNLLLLQLLPDISTTDACVGNNFACRMEFFGRRCRQPTFRTHALLVEPASRAPKNLGESKASTNNRMAACAAKRNGMQNNDKRPVPAFLSASTLSMKTFSRKTGSKKKHLLEEKQHALEGQHNSQTAPTKSLTSLFDKFYCLLPLLLLLPPLLLLLLKPRTKSL